MSLSVMWCSLVVVSICSGFALAFQNAVGDEQRYLNTLPAILALSYQTPLPPLLHSNCVNSSLFLNNNNALNFTLPSSSILFASQVSSLCSPTTICTLPASSTLLMDASLNVGALIVYGNLLWNDDTQSGVDQYLCAGYVAVNGGVFNMSIVRHRSFIYIKNSGLVEAMLRRRAFGGYNHATILISGRPLRRTWTLIAANSAAIVNQGIGQFQLMHNPVDMGWRIGDRIVIAPTQGGSSGWAQWGFIRAFGTNNVLYLGNYSSSTTYYPNGLGAVSDLLNATTNQAFQANAVYVPEAWTAHLQAEVVNMARSIIITGDDFENVACVNSGVNGITTDSEGCLCDSSIPRSVCTVGLHTALMYSGVMRVSYTRVEKCGQRAVVGKYCLHFHLLSNCSQCAFIGNAIEYGQQRAIVVHGTHLTKVEMNVISDVRGAHVYIEDGNEMYNRIYYNVAICPWPLNQNQNAYYLGGCSIPGTDNGQADTDLNQSGFWAVGFVNYLIGNRAVNSFNGMLWQEQGVAGGRGVVSGLECANRMGIGRLEGNTFHGHGRFGTYLLADVFPLHTDQSLWNNGEITDFATCYAWNTDGSERGMPQVIQYEVDYDNVFVGQYAAGDVQYRHHSSINNNALIYWKETKNFADGCSSHLQDSLFAGKGGSMLALPSGHGTFVMENLRITQTTGFESNHHCNVGTTGALLCMPQYVFVNITWQSEVQSSFNWFFFNPDTNNGALFTLGPDDIKYNRSIGIFPNGFVSLANPYWTYLFGLDNHTSCFNASDTATLVNWAGGTAQFMNLYNNGILCRRPLRRLEVFTHGLSNATNWSTALILELYQNGVLVSSQRIPYFQIGSDSSVTQKQGFSMTVVPNDGGSPHNYRLSLETGAPFSGVGGGPLPLNWTIEFSDTIFGNRWAVDTINLEIVGRNCPSPVTSMHDRRFIWANSDEFLATTNIHGATGLGRGACSGFPDMPATPCSSVPPIAPFGICSSLCSPGCGANSFCDCGTATCQCNAGYFGPECQLNVCDKDSCGPNGRCADLYMGGGLNASLGQCVCQPGYYGAHCNANPCANVMCSGHGTCSVLDATHYACNCNSGWNGDACDANCTGSYPKGTCQPACSNGARLYPSYDLFGNDIGNVGGLTSVSQCISACQQLAGCASFTFAGGSTCYMKTAAAVASASNFAASTSDKISGVLCTSSLPSVPEVAVSTVDPSSTAMAITATVMASLQTVFTSTSCTSSSTSSSSSSCRITKSGVTWTSATATAVTLSGFASAGSSACCAQCGASAKCVGWTLNGDSCTLFSEISGYTSSGSSVSGLLCSSTSSSTTSSSSSLAVASTCFNGNCSVYVDTYLSGGDVGTTLGELPSDCCDACESWSFCVAWSWYEGVCFLKSQAALVPSSSSSSSFVFVSQLGTVSGVLRCEANSTKGEANGGGSGTTDVPTTTVPTMIVPSSASLSSSPASSFAIMATTVIVMLTYIHMTKRS